MKYKSVLAITILGLISGSVLANQNTSSFSEIDFASATKYGTSPKEIQFKNSYTLTVHDVVDFTYCTGTLTILKQNPWSNPNGGGMGIAAEGADAIVTFTSDSPPNSACALTMNGSGEAHIISIANSDDDKNLTLYMNYNKGHTGHSWSFDTYSNKQDTSHIIFAEDKNTYVLKDANKDSGNPEKLCSDNLGFCSEN
ncbi:hypothetical protein [Piscirickettsia litoralis]|uniref:Secreted protein n=1 Tax=Piscirickettsia litoralis TaxID=1891921 RepID=A0ABX2ZY12_9GAMM|nr:hypothetical protein [Piscirickettsia litoralis]ODN41486.1 hypothetical protein BGC07_15340 [Piscirickettsia litoralis]